MPAKYTCEGLNLSPPLAWSDLPSGTKTLALVVDDPDAPDPAAPQRTWVHWVLADIPASATDLNEGASPSGLPPSTRVGKNDWGKPAYGGPCPPVGRHRYFFKLYALDGVLELTSFTKADLEKAMQNHVLGKAELIGTYQKGQ
jgi:Raf kinase inhibitor-like YbhB/YbcL family protein